MCGLYIAKHDGLALISYSLIGFVVVYHTSPDLDPIAQGRYNTTAVMYWFRSWLEDLTDEQATDLRIIVPCWVHVHNFLSNQELYGTMWNYMELYGTINIIWDHSSHFPTTRSHFSIIVIVMLGAQTWTPGDALVVDSSLDHLTARQNAQPVGLVEGYPLVNQRNYGKKSPFFMGKSTISMAIHHAING